MKVKMCFGRVAWFATMVAIGLGLAASASAETVLVDFGSNLSFRGATVPNPDPKGHYWNSFVPGAFVQNMRDINNVTTTIDLGFDGTGVGTDSYNGPAGATDTPPTSSHIASTDIDTTALGNLGVLEAGFDYAASPGPDGSGNMAANLCRFQIQQLNPAETYSLTLFGSHKYSADTTTDYTVYNEGTYTNLIGSTSLNVHDPVDFSMHNRNTVATISGLTPDVNGILYVQFVGATGAQGYLNSMQITGVPEPSTLLLLGCGGAALLAGFRRRR